VIVDTKGVVIFIGAYVLATIICTGKPGMARWREAASLSAIPPATEALI
jgi:hypothetical protein